MCEALLPLPPYVFTVRCLEIKTSLQARDGLFICCGLFNDAVSSPDSMALNDE
jgi:hypothetical protein